MIRVSTMDITFAPINRDDQIHTLDLYPIHSEKYTRTASLIKRNLRRKVLFL